MSAMMVHVRDPFRHHVNRTHARIRRGTRVDTVLRAHGLITGKGRRMVRNSTFVVAIGVGSNAYLTQDDWGRRLKDDEVMTVLAVPKGGGGLRTVALIVVAVVAAWVTSGASIGGTATFTGGYAVAAGAAVSIAGPMLGKAVCA